MALRDRSSVRGVTAPPEVNPYAPAKGGDPAEGPRKPSRWLAVLVSLLSSPFAGSGLLILGRRRMALITMGVGVVAWALFALPIAPGLSGLAALAIPTTVLVGLVMTVVARPGQAPPRSEALVMSIVLVVGGIGGGLLTRRFLAEAFQIPSGAMIPTLLIGDHFLVDKTAGRPPQRGDVIVFPYPLGKDDYIKRVMALPGQEISFADGHVLIDGQPLPRRSLDEPCDPAVVSTFCRVYEETAGDRTYRIIQAHEHSPNAPSLRIPPGHVFVMGDNRDNSNDSRFWGTVPIDTIKGRARTVWYSRVPDGPVRWERSGISIR